MTWDLVVGPLTAVMVAALLAVYSLGVVRRERRGPGPRMVTLANSSPWSTTAAIWVAMTAAILVLVRLGVMS